MIPTSAVNTGDRDAGSTVRDLRADLGRLRAGQGVAPENCSRQRWRLRKQGPPAACGGVGRLLERMVLGRSWMSRNLPGQRGFPDGIVGSGKWS